MILSKQMSCLSSVDDLLLQMLRRTAWRPSMVIHGVADAQKSWISGFDAQRGLFSNVKNVFMIHAQDRWGHDLDSGGDAFTAMMVAETGYWVDAEILDLRNGTYRVSVQVEHAGRCVSCETFRKAIQW